MRYSWLLCTLLLGVGCAENSQYFRPTEHVHGQTMQGQPEAIYALVGSQGTFGEAKVWSPGAFHKDGATVLHVQMDLHNTSGTALVIKPEQIRLEPVRVGRDLLHDIAPVERQALSVAPGAFGRVSLSFTLPAGVRAGEISAFGLRWSVQNGPQSYAQLTPFLEDTRSRGPYYRPVYGYGYSYFCGPYDPFCGPGFYGYSYGYYPGAVIVSPSPARGNRQTVRVR